MPAVTYRHRGEHIPVATASAALAAGTLTYQEGVFGIVITGCDSGGSTELDVLGVHNIAVPSGTVKGTKLYATLSGDATTVSLIRTGMTAGDTLIGVALTARDTDGKALVKFADQPASTYPASEQTELATLASAIPTAAVADVATADADGTYGAAEANLINELKTQVNALLARLRTAGIITP